MTAAIYYANSAASVVQPSWVIAALSVPVVFFFTYYVLGQSKRVLWAVFVTALALLLQLPAMALAASNESPTDATEHGLRQHVFLCVAIKEGATVTAILKAAPMTAPPKDAAQTAPHQVERSSTQDGEAIHGILVPWEGNVPFGELKVKLQRRAKGPATQGQLAIFIVSSTGEATRRFSKQVTIAADTDSAEETFNLGPN